MHPQDIAVVSSADTGPVISMTAYRNGTRVSTSPVTALLCCGDTSCLFLISAMRSDSCTAKVPRRVLYILFLLFACFCFYCSHLISISHWSGFIPLSST